MTIREINQKNIWEIVRPISELQKNTRELYDSCQENLEDIRNIILEASSQIKFDEKEHRYFYKEEECISASNIVHLFIPETNFDLVAQNYVKKNNLKDSWQRVKQVWNLKALLSTTQGTHNHAFCEDLTNICNGKNNLQLSNFCLQKLNNQDYYIPLCEKQIAGYKYLEYCLSNQEIPFLVEVKLVLDEHKISGTFDQLIYSIKDKGFKIRDYKTNEVLIKDFKKPMKSPFVMYNEEPLSHYIIQQNLYSLMLNALGIKIIGKDLVWLKENGTFELLSLPNIEDQVLKAVENLY